jgi:putative SOS response-associated peptidase YedK
MCANYAPSRADILSALTSLEVAFGVLPEVYPGQLAPIICISKEGEMQCLNSTFGLIPAWSKDPKFSRFTYNARSETAATKPSFRSAWSKRHLALTPMQHFYEPNYETGKAIRWRIGRNDESVFFAASLWEWRPGPTPEGLFSHTLLTVNATEHPLMKRFHAPDDEKRSIVTFDWQQGMSWLTDNHSKEQGLLIDTLKPVDAQTYAASAAPIPTKNSTNLPAKKSSSSLDSNNAVNPPPTQSSFLD